MAFIGELKTRAADKIALVVYLIQCDTFHSSQTYELLLPISFRKHAKASVSINKPASGGNDSTSKSPSGKKSNVLTANLKLHRRLGAGLRSVVEAYASTPAGWRRRPNTRRIDIDFGSSQANTADGAKDVSNEEIHAKLRAAFALRESKEHEQRDLVNATLKAENAKLRRGWGLSQVTGAGGAGSTVGGAPGAATLAGVLPPLETVAIRKKRLDGIAKQLREKEKGAVDRVAWKKIARKAKSLVSGARLCSLCESGPSIASHRSFVKILNPESTAKAILAESQQSPPAETTGSGATVKSPDQSRQLKRKREEDQEQRKERERQRKIEEAKKREQVLQDRLAREEAEKRRAIEKEREEQERRERVVETPRDALHRLLEPIFTALWDMEFAALGNTNPFRMVIDSANCADMGVSDYCNIIKKPMNLTYIQTKVNNKSYETLQEFVEDVDLIAKNAMQYNFQTNNPYHVAAKTFRKKFRKLAKPLVQSLTQGMALK